MAITEDSPACVAIMQLVRQTPGITAKQISTRGGWSVFHIRNCLRFLKAARRIERTRPLGNGECCWWLCGQAIQPIPKRVRVRKPRVLPPVVTTAPNSIFALGAA